ncbi:hypothetical protein HETIRDRAFT_425924 [Heterobasidion irregulare TC 32-1]|uniref:Uncharacterized protein n=1 Tax=Heterobasidion irregulare (strain TC 32-1) TaxID=747525 RepID=W4KHV9_HETIT|nr:uncharacterized protein HETIRDRAFT_425924 [Heterobasidion irregulare TC 32-1]ETW84666.1 hypothetical protein HETIRDRAFT_425924 [Heterobasidion irregulare TC 32-1]
MRLGHSFAIVSAGMSVCSGASALILPTQHLAPLWLSPLVVPDPECNLGTSTSSNLRPAPRIPSPPITALLSHCREYLSRVLPSPSSIYTYAHHLHHLLKSRCAYALSRLPIPNFRFRPPSIPIPPLPRWLLPLAPHPHPHPLPLHAKYASPADEQKYWAAAARGQRALAPSDARARDAPQIPLVLSYVPRLLPPYRTRTRTRAHTDAERAEYALPPAAFRKWHRMVFPGKNHPSLKRAAVLLKRYSSRDRREMHRIARLLPDAAVFGASFRWTPVYRDMWTRWLDAKGPDIAIVFE